MLNTLDKSSLKNQMASHEKQKSCSFKCTGKFVFGFQDDLCSLSRLENQILGEYVFWPQKLKLKFFNVEKHPTQLCHV